MTVREYISSTLPGLTVPESFYVDYSIGPDDVYSPSMYSEVGAAMVGMLGGLIMAPKVSSVSENGFSMQWDTTTLGKYYLWLCKRYGITPDSDIVALLGMNTVLNISDTW